MEFDITNSYTLNRRENMDKIISVKRYICGKEEFNFSELYRQCDKGVKELPINVFLLEHKKYGNILINSGCSKVMKKNLTAYTAFTSKHKIIFDENDAIGAQLTAEGKDPLIIRKVLLTQCTPECCGGLSLLPKYELISTAQVLTILWLADTKDGIMKSTLPDSSIKKSAAGIFKGKSFLKDYFKWVFDVFGDGTVLAVDISGAAKSMAGFYLPEKKLFFCADASTDISVLEEGLIPAEKLLSKVFYPDDYISVNATLRRIHKENPEITLVFNHSEDFAEIK